MAAPQSQESSGQRFDAMRALPRKLQTSGPHQTDEDLGHPGRWRDVGTRESSDGRADAAPANPAGIFS